MSEKIFKGNDIIVYDDILTEEEQIEMFEGENVGC